MITIILSILFPGLGQIYLGKNGRGIAMIVLGITPLYPVALIWSIVDIIQQNRKGTIPAFSRQEAIRATVLFIVVIPLCFFILGFGGSFLIQKFNKSNQPRLTEKEGREIAEAIDRLQEQTGKLPESINDLINLRPPRSGWRTDSWGNSYIYNTQKDETYTLASSGADGQPNTSDDIVIRK
jgi:uncharacterized protein YneF (UPF0154 family)